MDLQRLDLMYVMPRLYGPCRAIVNVIVIMSDMMGDVLSNVLQHQLFCLLNAYTHIVLV